MKVRYKLPRPEPAESRVMPKPPTRVARMLALAYLIERKVEGGELQSYAEAARLLGITRARVTQIVNMLNLPVDLQEGILTGEVEMSERALRKLAR